MLREKKKKTIHTEPSPPSGPFLTPTPPRLGAGEVLLPGTWWGRRSPRNQCRIDSCFVVRTRHRLISFQWIWTSDAPRPRVQNDANRFRSQVGGVPVARSWLSGGGGQGETRLATATWEGAMVTRSQQTPKFPFPAQELSHPARALQQLLFLLWAGNEASFSLNRIFFWKAICSFISLKFQICCGCHGKVS